MKPGMASPARENGASLISVRLGCAIRNRLPGDPGPAQCRCCHGGAGLRTTRFLVRMCATRSDRVTRCGPPCGGWEALSSAGAGSAPGNAGLNGWPRGNVLARGRSRARRRERMSSHARCGNRGSKLSRTPALHVAWSIGSACPSKLSLAASPTILSRSSRQTARRPEFP